MGALWEILKNLLNPRTEDMVYKENIDYIFKPYEEDITAIELLKSPYQGVLYHYLSVRFDEKGEVGVLGFQYTIIEPTSYTIEELEGDQTFHTLLGDILVQIMITEGMNE
jgi:hypothetical protein